MVDRPETVQVETFAAAGAGTIIIHPRRPQPSTTHLS
jgi:hypothetical protein